MATPTTAALKAILDAGTYPSGTLATDLIYDYPKPASRKRYPSLEIELDKPQGFNETKEGTRFSHRFKITYFHRVLGTGTDDIVNILAANVGNNFIGTQIQTTDDIIDVEGKNGD